MIDADASTVRERRVPGEAGTWVLLLGDMAVFAVFFATFLVQRSHAPQLFDEARQTLHLGIGMLNTLVLLTSSAAVVIGLTAHRAGHRSAARRSVWAAASLGGVFVAVKVLEYILLISHGHGTDHNAFYLYYFILTGVHLVHVVVAVVVMTVTGALMGTRDPSPVREAVIESGCLFWHLVDLLWIVLFALLYLVS